MAKRRWNNVPLALGVVAATSLAYNAHAQNEVPTLGGTAIFTLPQDPGGVNPDTTTNVPDRLLGCIFYQGLLHLSPDYKILPLLAKTWSVSPDGLTYTFDLVDTQWSDGRPLGAEDVKYTLLEVSAKMSASFASAGRAIDAIEAPTPSKVIIKLKQPFGPFLIALSCYTGGAILPSHLFRGTEPLKNPASLDKPVVTGPFTLTEWKRGDYVRLTKNPKYWEPGKPYLDEIIAKVITAPAARLQALRAGEVDIVQYLPASVEPAVHADPKLKVEVSAVAPQISQAFLNVEHKPLNDKRVRQALFMAIDREYLLKNVFFNVGTVATAPFTTKITWAVNPDIDYTKMYPFNIARANALLDEAGVKRGAGGKRFTMRAVLFANQYTEFQQVATAIKGWWQQLGVDLIIETMEDATLFKRVYVDRDFDLHMLSNSSLSDPAFGIGRTFVTSSIGKVYGNPEGYSNPEVDALFEKGERATSYEERAPFYRQIQAILAEDLPVVQLRQFIEIDGVSKKLHGIWGKSQGNGLWSEAWMEK